MAKFKLGEIAHECRTTWSGSRTDVPIVGLEHLIPGEIKLTNWDKNTENTFNKKFSKGQVLLGRRRVYLRKAVEAPCDGICSGDITVIETCRDIVLPELLPFIIQNDKFFDFAMQGSAGSLSPRVKWEHLANYEVDLPSIDEQRTLVKKLLAANKLKESYKRLLIATDEMVKSQFIEMFGCESNAFKGDKTYAFDDICYDDTKCAVKVPASEYQKDGKFPIFDQSQDTYIAGYTSNEDSPCEDVPVILFGDHSRVFKYINQPFYIGADGVKLIRAKKPNINTAFMYYSLLYKNIPNTGYNRHFKWVKLQKFVLPPMVLQEEFVSIARQADKSKYYN